MHEALSLARSQSFVAVVLLRPPLLFRLSPAVHERRSRPLKVQLVHLPSPSHMHSHLVLLDGRASRVFACFFLLSFSCNGSFVNGRDLYPGELNKGTHQLGLGRTTRPNRVRRLQLADLCDQSCLIVTTNTSTSRRWKVLCARTRDDHGSKVTTTNHAEEEPSCVSNLYGRRQNSSVDTESDIRSPHDVADDGPPSSVSLLLLLLAASSSASSGTAMAALFWGLSSIYGAESRSCATCHIAGAVVGARRFGLRDVIVRSATSLLVQKMKMTWFGQASGGGEERAHILHYLFKHDPVAREPLEFSSMTLTMKVSSRIGW
ncbi:hypothetical protein KCU61_g70, partial [Aureobasidium melanogenum]